MNLLTGRNTEIGTKTIVAGGAGLGKTTLASKIPGAIILDVEDGASLVEATRTPVPKNYAEVVEFLRDLYKNAEQYGLKTLVIDTIDKLETLAIQDMLESDPKHPKSIEQYGGGYGKGYTAIAEKMESFTKTLDSFRNKGINVVLIAHDKIIHLDNPDTLTPYDTYSINVTKQTRPILIAWADSVLFMKRDVTVMNGDSKAKAVRSERVILTDSTPAYPDTKNRFGLTGQVPATYEAVETIFKH